MERGARRGEAALDRLGRKATETQTQFEILRKRLNGFRAVLASIGFGITIREFTRLLDATTTIDNRLRLVTRTTEELNVVYGKLLQISNKTRTSLSDNADIFNRVAIATRSLGLTYGEQLELTERLNKALIISGATAQEGAAALRQLGQALGTGRLSGDEFISVNENLPRLMQAIADSIGVPRGELKKLAADGKITAEVIVKAMKDAADSLDSEFTRITPTISGAFTVLSNNIQDFVRDINNAGAIGEIFARGVLFVADNLKVFIAGLAALSVMVVGSVIPSLVALTRAFLATPIGRVAALISAGVIAIAEFGDKTVEVGERTVTVWQTIKASLNTVAGIFGQIYDAAVTALTGILESLEPWAEEARKVFVKVLEWSKAAWDGAKDAASGFFSVSRSRIDEWLGNWNTSLDKIVEWISSSVNYWIGLFVGFISAIRPIISDGIPALFKLGLAVAKNFVIDGLQEIVETFVEGLGSIGDAFDYIPGVEGVGQSIRESLKVDLSKFRSNTEEYRRQVDAVRDNIEATFDEALSTDYIGNLGNAIGKGARTVQSVFTESILDPFNNAVTRAGEVLSKEFNGNLDKVIENQETSAKLQEILNRKFTEGVPSVTNFGSGAGSAADKLSELNKLRQQFIDGIVEEYSRIRQESGYAQEQVTLWYSEQLLQLHNLGLAYTEYADMLEYIFRTRLREAREQDLANAADWVSGIQRSLMQLEKEIGNTANVAEKAFAEAFNKSADALADFVLTGKLDFAELARSIIADIVRIMTRMLLLRALQSTLGFFGFADGGLVPRFADGGLVTGPGTSTSDSIFARLSKGEFVVNADATRQFLPLLRQINEKKVPKYATGGVVGTLAQTMPVPTSRKEDQDRNQRPTIIVNISTPNVESFRQSETQIAAQLRRIVQRGARGT
jgi:tape measure domain-containing protein